MLPPHSSHSPAPQKAQSDPDGLQSLFSELVQPGSGPASVEARLNQVTRIAQLLSSSLGIPKSDASQETSFPQTPRLVALYSTAFELLQRSLEQDRMPDAALAQVATDPQETYNTLAASLNLPEERSSSISPEEPAEPLSAAARATKQFRSALLLAFKALDTFGHPHVEKAAAAAKFRHCAEVGLSLLAAGCQSDVVVAGILHDVLELSVPRAPSYLSQASYAPSIAQFRAALQRKFSSHVESLVSAVTEPARIPDKFDFLFRKAAIWQRLQAPPEGSGFVTDAAAIVCASKANTLAAGINFLERNGTAEGWSSGSIEQNLFLCDALRKRFIDAKVPAVLVEKFDRVAAAWRDFLPAPCLPSAVPKQVSQLSDFDAEALLRSRQITIVTGGQTGVDRAALDVAMALGYRVEGFCPAGRLAEDGPLHERYSLKAAPVSDNSWRTIANAHDSDATLILSRGTPNDGTPLTTLACEFYAKPCLELSLDRPANPSEFVSFLQRHRAVRLNIAGPRESLEPGNVYEPAFRILRSYLAPEYL